MSPSCVSVARGCVSVARGCVSVALLTFAQPHTRNHTRANLRSAVRRATRRRGVTRHTAAASRASALYMRTSRREATHAPPRPAWPVSRRSVLLHALAHLPALAARRRRAAPRATQPHRKPGAVLIVAIDRGKQLATRALEPRRTMPIELTPATKTSYSVARPPGRATFYTTATPSAQACATRGVRSPQPIPLRSRASVRRAPRCRATDVNLDGERRATTCLVADARATAPALPW